MDRRWQLVLDCMDADRPPFSKGTLVGFQARLSSSGGAPTMIRDPAGSTSLRSPSASTSRTS
jgi:hypothetical protein